MNSLHATEIAAAKQDFESTARLLIHAANALKDTARIPRAAHIGYAQTILTHRTDLIARVRLRQYAEAATAYEGARVAVADLANTNQRTTA